MALIASPVLDAVVHQTDLNQDWEAGGRKGNFWESGVF